MAETKNQNLCSFTRNQGCAAKTRKAFLKRIINSLPELTNKYKKGIVCDYGSFDDAAVYRLDKENSLVCTVDFITPVTNDPGRFGQIAVANSLSDIYAKGAVPTLGLNILGFPQEKIGLEIIEKILKAAHKRAEEAGISIIGGHTINLSEIFYGLAAFGMVKNDELILNSGASDNDVLMLTKPLGTNVVFTLANRMGAEIKPAIVKNCLDLACELNKVPSILMKEVGVNACTDISGYGFIGHLSQMLEASKKKAVVYSAKVPVIKESLNFVQMSYHACSIEANKKDFEDSAQFSSVVPAPLRELLFDAHTSGGLLISLPEKKAVTLLSKLHKNKISHASIVGRIVDAKRQKSLVNVE